VVYRDWANAYCHQLRRRGKAHHAILRALAFKWLRIHGHCWYDGVAYDDARYRPAFRRVKSKFLPQTVGLGLTEVA